MKDEEFKTANARALNDDVLESVSGGIPINFMEKLKELNTRDKSDTKILPDDGVDDSTEAF